MPVDVATLMRRFWHPVCRVSELTATGGGRGPLPVTLCGEPLAIVDLGAGPVALEDRCPHRSTKLSLGWVDDRPEGAALQCAYHGWRWDSAGRCVGIPSVPEARPGAGLPARRVPSYDAEVRYGLVWVRLESGWPTSIPECPGFDDPGMRAVAGEPYVWPVSVARRVENAVDMAHFAWVHDGSLGDREHPEVPELELRREAGALRFEFDPPALPVDTDPAALVGPSAYTVSLNGTVDIRFEVPGRGRRELWLTASPVDAVSCRTFWFTIRSDDLDGDDQPHLDIQHLVLEEDLRVISGQHPADIPWTGPDRELSVGTDAVSLAFRRFLLDCASTDTPDELAAVLHLDAAVPA